MRLFVAIELDDRTRAAVSAAAGSLRLFGSGRFCPEDSYHITLAFIGESDRAKDIEKVMDEVVSPCFELSLEGLGHFSTTYFVGIEDSAPLKALQKCLCAGLKAAGFAIDNKGFTPHITLARRFAAQCPPVVFVPERCFGVRGISLMTTVGPGIYRRLYYKSFVG